VFGVAIMTSLNFIAAYAAALCLRLSA